MPSRKGQGLSLNTVIIGILVLLVLFILVGIMTGYFSQWTDKFKRTSATSCSELGGKVIDSSAKCSDEYSDAGAYYEDTGEGKKCCRPKSCGERVTGGVGTACVETAKCELKASAMTGCSSGKTCCLV